MEPIVEQLGKFFLTIDKVKHNASNAYERLTIVSDSNDVMYISITDVPAGVPLTNTDYWFPYPAGRPFLNVTLLDVTKEFTEDSYPELNAQKWYICSNANNDLTGGVATVHDSLGMLIHATEINAGKHVGVHLGDVLIVFNINNIVFAKVFTDDEARAPQDNVLIHGILTSQDKEKIDFKFREEQNINNMLETGFYYGTLGRPTGSEDGEFYHVSVKTSTIKDNNGNYSIEQILYDIKYPSKAFIRVGFTQDKVNVTWEDYRQISGTFADKSGSNANEDVETGFYGYVTSNIPSEATSWGSLAVRRSDKADGNGFVSIEQTFYGRNGEDNGKVWFRLIFYNINTQEYQRFNWTNSYITDISSIVPEAGSYSSEENFIPGTYILKYGNLPATGGTITPTVVLYPLIKSIVNNKEVYWYKKPDNIRYSIVGTTGYSALCSINENTGVVTCPQNSATDLQTVKVNLTYTINNNTYSVVSTTDITVAPSIAHFVVDPSPANIPWEFTDVQSVTKTAIIGYPIDYSGDKNIEHYYNSKNINDVVGKLKSYQGITYVESDLKFSGIGSSIHIIDDEGNEIYMPSNVSTSATITFKAAVNNPGPSVTLKTTSVIDLILYCE